MSSSFAQRFQQQARPLLWREHGETVQAFEADGSSFPLPVIWQRRDPKTEDQDGAGIDTYFAVAVAVVRVSDLPEPHGQLELEREGERWAIRLVELQDEWTWLLHLAHPRDELRLPEGIR
jgi:hypothetical protein